MSIYAGLSLKEIYVKRCGDYNIKSNSALVKSLPTIPDDFHSLRVLDISNNFLGPKGIHPLMRVIECCTELQALDFRSQQLNKEAIDALCATLRTHRSVRCINLSDNPVNITAAVGLLELAKENTNIEEILLFNTQVRGTMLSLIEAQTRNNLEAKKQQKASNREKNEKTSVSTSMNFTLPSTADTGDAAGVNLSGISRRAASPPSGTGAAAAVSLQRQEQEEEQGQSTAFTEEGKYLCKRIPPTVIKNALAQFPCSVHSFLLDRDPLPTLHKICEENELLFYDTQFPADCKKTQKLDTYVYGAKNFKRVSEIYPNAKVFPEGSGYYELPTQVPSGFEWIFTCLRASVPTLEDLRKLFYFPPEPKEKDEGLYGARLFIDGAWRFVFIDDFLPVDHQGSPMFTKGLEGSNGELYTWPCLLEKLLAKVHGGYNALDTNISNPESALHHRLFRDPVFSEVKDSVTPPRRTTCARLMADFTGGVNVVRYMHREGFDIDAWWKNLDALMDTDPPTIAVAVSRNASKKVNGIDPSWVYQIQQARQVNGLRLVQLSCHDCVSSWQGSWCDESPEWEAFPDVAAILNRSRPARTGNGDWKPSFHPTVKQPASFHTSGRARKANLFWMSYVDFVTAFEEVHVCRTFEDFHERVIGGKWECKTSGGHVRGERWYANPHFRFRVDKKAPCFVNLALRDSRFKDNSIGSISFQILKMSKFPLLCPNSVDVEDGVIFKPKYYHTESLSFEGVLEPGDDYWIIPNTFMSGQFGSFFLRICSESSFIISEENIKDHWYLHTVEGDMGSAGELQLGEAAAQISLAFSQSGVRVGPHPKSVLGNLSPTDEDSGIVIVKASRKLPVVEDPLPWENEEHNAKVPIALLMLQHRDPANECTRISGEIEEDILLAETPFRLAEFTHLEAVVSRNSSYNVVCCSETKTENMTIIFHIWSSIPIDRVTSLPPWKKEFVMVDWGSGSGSYYHAANNPQVEVYPVRAEERLIVRMTVSEYSGDGAPAIIFFAIRNKGRLGEGVQGLVPTDRIITRSPYVRHRWVQCEIHVDEDMDSLLLMPCLQPVGSKGKCLMEVYSDLGSIAVRALSTRH